MLHHSSFLKETKPQKLCNRCNILNLLYHTFEKLLQFYQLSWWFKSILVRATCFCYCEQKENQDIRYIYKLFYFVTEYHFDLVYTIKFQTNVNIYNTKNYLINDILYSFRLKISKGQNIIYKTFISVIRGITVFYLCNNMKQKKRVQN